MTIIPKMPKGAVNAATKAWWNKKINRATKRRSRLISERRALPPVKTNYINSNYTNPVTLNHPPWGALVYKVLNHKTGRTNYYNMKTFKTFLNNWNWTSVSDYSILMAQPKVPLFRNPITRNPVYPRNVQRVRVQPKKKTPSPNTAAKKIQSAVRKMLSKKRAAKPKTPSPNKSKTPVKSKSKSKSRSK